jgi:hypothetical protein
MKILIQQHNTFLRSTKQRIVQKLNVIDCPIDIATGTAYDMDAETATLREIFYQYKNDDGGQLFEAIEKTNRGGTFRFLFHERNTETVENTLSNLDETLNTFGVWDDCDVHFQYLKVLPIIVVGCIAKSTTTAFWTNHLAVFTPNGIPLKIDTYILQYITNNKSPWVRASYSDIVKGRTAASATVPITANASAKGNDGTSAYSGLQGG